MVKERIAKQIEDMFDEVYELYGGHADPEYCYKAAESCIEAKDSLIQMLSKHPKWDADNLRVHFNADYTRPADTGMADSCVGAIANEIIAAAKDRLDDCEMDEEWFAEYEHYFCVSTEGRPRPALLVFAMNLWGVRKFRSLFACNSVITDEAEALVKKILPDARIHAGTKSTRALFKLLQQYGWEDYIRGFCKRSKLNPVTLEVTEEDCLTRARKKYTEYADYMNELSVTRHTVLSVNPMDFLRMSYGNSWQSCHYISTDGDESGCYSAGCWSYAYDNQTMIFFTVDAGVDDDNITYADKYTRQLYFWNGSALLPSRVYPAEDNLSDPVYKSNREIVEQIIADCTGYGNLWKNMGKKSTELDIDSRGMHYRDYNCHSYPVYMPTFLVQDSADKDMTDFMNFAIGSDKAICVCCGNRLDEENYPICYSCARGRYTCERCGDTYHSEDDGSYVEGSWACRYCVDNYAVWDEYEEEYIWTSNAVYVEDYGYVHEDRCDEYHGFYQCEYCGRWFRYDDDGEWAGGDWYCNECAEEHLATCSRCGELLPIEDMYRMPDGEYVCSDCLDQETEFVCACCGTTYPVDEVAETIDGRKYCKSCYDSRRHVCDDCGKVFYLADGGYLSFKDPFKTHEHVCQDCLSRNYYQEFMTYRLVKYDWAEAADTVPAIRVGDGTRITLETKESMLDYFRRGYTYYYRVFVPKSALTKEEQLMYRSRITLYDDKAYYCMPGSLDIARRFVLNFCAGPDEMKVPVDHSVDAIYTTSSSMIYAPEGWHITGAGARTITLDDGFCVPLTTTNTTE